jgi:hypothetical protein
MRKSFGTLNFGLTIRLDRASPARLLWLNERSHPDHSTARAALTGKRNINTAVRRNVWQPPICNRAARARGFPGQAVVPFTACLLTTFSVKHRAWLNLNSIK